MLPVLEGREAGVLFEFPEKIPEIIKTAVQTDVHNGLISGLKKDDGLFDPVFVDIGYRGFPEYFLEKRQKYCSFILAFSARSRM